jgi:hypothetical protein
MLADVTGWAAAAAALLTLIVAIFKWYCGRKEATDAHNAQIHQQAGSAAASDDDSDLSDLLRPK